MQMKSDYLEEYNNLLAHAEKIGLDNTIKALTLLEETLRKTPDKYREDFKKDIHRALRVADNLQSLCLPLCKEEQASLLAAALCRVFRTSKNFGGSPIAAIKGAGIPSEINDILDILSVDLEASEEVKARCRERIMSNKLALLISLASQSIFVMKLYKLPSWSAHKYIYETRNYYFPMCIYAKEHYPELLSPISILMDKMRTQTELTELMLAKYESKETELTRDILALREENATIKGILHKLRNE